MSIEDYQTALAIIQSHEDADFVGFIDEKTIQKAESLLNLQFPPSYRNFLKDLGCGDIRGLEFYGIVDDNFESNTIPDGIWLTLQQRKETNLSKELILISSNGYGTYMAIDTSQINSEKESPIVELSFDMEKRSHVSSSFGAFLNNSISELY